MPSNKGTLLEAFRTMGRLQAQAIRERAVNMTGTEIIDAELFVPEWKPSNYTVIGQPIRYNGEIYALRQAHDSTANTGWFPSANTASLWKHLRTKNPDKATPYRIDGGHDGYMKGEVCMYNGQAYRSKTDNNVYSPGEHAANWEKAV